MIDRFSKIFSLAQWHTQ